MIAINPLNAVISDIAVVEHNLKITEFPLDGYVYPSVEAKCKKAGEQYTDDMVSVSVELTMRVEVAVSPTAEPYYSETLVVGCTVVGQQSDNEDRVDVLERYGTEVCIGFARTFVYQQSLSSMIHEAVIIPPLSIE